MIPSDDHDNDGDIDGDIDGDGNQVSSSTPSSSMLPLICRGEKLIRGESTDTLIMIGGFDDYDGNYDNGDT